MRNEIDQIFEDFENFLCDRGYYNELEATGDAEQVKNGESEVMPLSSSPRVGGNLPPS